jgi:hypothetical protein
MVGMVPDSEHVQSVHSRQSVQRKNLFRLEVLPTHSRVLPRRANLKAFAFRLDFDDLFCRYAVSAHAFAEHLNSALSSETHF